jgi:ribosome-binding protein aMBF1 (putative translation factor)
MNIKSYSDVFGEAQKNPNYQQYLEEHRARILLAEAVHRERNAQHLSMKELADKAQTTPAVISRIEHSQVSAGIDVVYKIFKALGKNKLVLEF